MHTQISSRNAMMHLFPRSRIVKWESLILMLFKQSPHLIIFYLYIQSKYFHIFGSPGKTKTKGKRFRWELEKENIPFCGSPFLLMGSVTYVCHQGGKHIDRKHQVCDCELRLTEYSGILNRVSKKVRLDFHILN